MIRGSCLCGGVRFEVARAVGPFELCHCSRCRKASGSAFVAGLGVNAEDYRLVQGEELISSYDAPILERPPAYRASFCRRCGSPVPNPFPADAFLELPAGLLDDHPGRRPDRHIFVEFEPAWSEISDDLPRLDKRALVELRRAKTSVAAEFGRQASSMAVAPAFHATEITERIGRALGPARAGRLLDIACGPGILAAALAGDARQLVGLDSTPEMIDLARARCAEAGLTNTEFRLGDAEALPFDNAEFDGVVSRLAVHHFSEPTRVLREARRVVRPEGQVVVADIVSSANGEEAALHNALERLRDPTHVRMLSKAELLDAIDASGLRVHATQELQQEREFEEWAAIVAEPRRMDSLREVLRGFARAGVGAGIGLSERDSRLCFQHQWLIASASPNPGRA